MPSRYLLIQIRNIYWQTSEKMQLQKQCPRRPGFKTRLSHTKDSKMVLDTDLLNTQHYKVCIKGKVEQSRKRSSTLLTPWCNRKWKESLQAAVNYTQQLHYIYIISLPCSIYKNASTIEKKRKNEITYCCKLLPFLTFFICRLFNTKSIFIQMNSSISNNSV